MFETATTRRQHDAIRAAHTARARAFQDAWNWLFHPNSR